MFGSTLGNLLGFLYFAVFQFAGILLSFLFLEKEKPPTKLLLGSCLGSLMLQWIPILFSFIFDFTLLSHLFALAALLPIFLLAIKKQVPVRKCIAGSGSALLRHKWFALAFTGTMILWIYLLHTHTIPMDESGSMYAGQCTYGDMNMHLGFITSIKNQQTFPPDYSLFPGTRLSYPFLSDSISSSIYLMGASLRFSYILPMLAAFAQVMGSVYLLAMTLLKSRGKALLTFALYFFNGGLGFLYFIDWAQNREYSFADIFTGFYTTPTNLVDHNIRWVNVIADMFLPQRATLFGYALLFPCIWLLHQAVFGREKNYFLYAGIFASALPMVHTHSFLAIGLISASWLLLYLFREVRGKKEGKWYGGYVLLFFVLFMSLLQYRINNGGISSDKLMLLGISGIGLCILCGLFLLVQYLRKQGYKELLGTWGIYLLCVLVLAVPQLLFWTFGQVAEGGFLRGHFNWGNLGDAYPWFYLKNIGLVLILIAAAICEGRKQTRHLLFPALVIWYLAELIVFTPNVYDNNKLLYPVYLLLCIVAADYAVELYRKLRDVGGIRFISFCFLFASLFSGILTLQREMVSSYQLYSADQVALAKYVEENTAPDAVFLTHTHHNNALPSLTGRNVVCGADTFLYFHGIDTSMRKQHVKAMLEAPLANLPLYELYDVSYVVISAYERSNYTIDENLFMENFELVFSSGNTNLYRVN